MISIFLHKYNYVSLVQAEYNIWRDILIMIENEDWKCYCVLLEINAKCSHITWHMCYQLFVFLLLMITENVPFINKGFIFPWGLMDSAHGLYPHFWNQK